MNQHTRKDLDHGSVRDYSQKQTSPGKPGSPSATGLKQTIWYVQDKSLSQSPLHFLFWPFSWQFRPMLPRSRSRSRSQLWYENRALSYRETNCILKMTVSTKLRSLFTWLQDNTIKTCTFLRRCHCSDSSAIIYFSCFGDQIGKERKGREKVYGPDDQISEVQAWIAAMYIYTWAELHISVPQVLILYNSVLWNRNLPSWVSQHHV